MKLKRIAGVIGILVIKKKTPKKAPTISLVFSFIEEQHFQVSLSTTITSSLVVVILDDNNLSHKEMLRRGPLRPVYSVGCFTLKSPEKTDHKKIALH